MGGTQVQYWMILADIVHFLCWVSTWRLKCMASRWKCMLTVWANMLSITLHSPHVFLEIWRMCKFCPTMWTSVWTFVSVFRLMVQFQIPWIWKDVSTMVTCIWLLPTVDSPLVALQVATLSECSPTVPTFISSLPCVSLKMFRFFVHFTHLIESSVINKLWPFYQASHPHPPYEGRQTCACRRVSDLYASLT